MTTMSGPLVNLPPDSVQVVDADEEIFLLYTGLQRGSASSDFPFYGLGQVDSSKDTMTLQFDIDVPSTSTKERDNDVLSKSRSRKSRGKVHKERSTTSTISVELVQDKTALRTRKGDTGSVLWRVTLEFAKLVLTQCHSTSNGDLSGSLPFLNPEMSRSANVLEIGAGTGILSVLLSPIVKHYTVTDIEPLLPLIRKNVALNIAPKTASSSSSPKGSTQLQPTEGSNITITPLDWEALHSTPKHRRPVFLESLGSDHFDLIIAADCIYHPSLIPPFLASLSTLTTPSSGSADESETQGCDVDETPPGAIPPRVGTIVLVIVQLREADVMREFLETWLKDPDSSWEIWRAGDDPGLLGRGYTVWVAWKKAKSSLV